MVTSLGGGTGRRTGLKIRGLRRFNNIRVLTKPTENIIQTHGWRGFLADLRSESGVKLLKIHRRQIGDMKPGGAPMMRTYNEPQSSSDLPAPLVVSGGG